VAPGPVRFSDHAIPDAAATAAMKIQTRRTPGANRGFWRRAVAMIDDISVGDSPEENGVPPPPADRRSSCRPLAPGGAVPAAAGPAVAAPARAGPAVAAPARAAPGGAGPAVPAPGHAGP